MCAQFYLFCALYLNLWLHINLYFGYTVLKMRPLGSLLTLSGHCCHLMDSAADLFLYLQACKTRIQCVYIRVTFSCSTVGSVLLMQA